MLIRFTVCSLCIWTFVVLVLSNFCFKGGTLVLIASVPGHCLSFTFHVTWSMRFMSYFALPKLCYLITSYVEERVDFDYL